MVRRGERVFSRSRARGSSTVLVRRERKAANYDALVLLASCLIALRQVGQRVSGPDPS